MINYNQKKQDQMLREVKNLCKDMNHYVFQTKDEVILNRWNKFKKPYHILIQLM